MLGFSSNVRGVLRLAENLDFLALLTINLSCHAENSNVLKKTHPSSTTDCSICAVFIVMLYYSKLSRHLKLNNTEILAHALWHKKSEVAKDEILKKVFKLDLEDKSIESLDASFSNHIEKLINRHRLERSADISALNRYLEMALS